MMVVRGRGVWLSLSCRGSLEVVLEMVLGEELGVAGGKVSNLDRYGKFNAKLHLF